MSGLEASAVMGKPISFLSVDAEGAASLEEMWKQVASTGGHWEGDVWCRSAEGDEYALRISATALRTENGRIDQYVLLLSDITERKRDEERIRYQANYDALTGLPNRSLFTDRLQQAVLSASRGQQRVGLMFIDLDGFKAVNDNLGHDMGDFLLKEAAKRISSCVREYDTVARLGGDEFTVVMPNIESSRDGAIVGQRILKSLDAPFVWGDRVGRVSGSIGIAMFPEDAPDAETLLRNADAAMYQAKSQGKANYQFYTADLNQEVHERQTIKEGLIGALERQEFQVHYQPRVSVAKGAITGVEALLRWKSPELGEVPPDKFISVLEEAGLMPDVGTWIIEQACRQQVEWRKAGVDNMRIAINLSVRQLRRPGLAAKIREIAEQTGANTSRLELELTEIMLIKDAESCVTTLWELRELGIKLVLDDFGTGYSSLTYLRRFPLEIIKIDTLFISGIATSSDDADMAKTIIDMGHGLGKTIVAEGVETEEQLAVLRTLGCDDAQGFLFCPPMKGSELNLLLARGRWQKAGG
ncbi:MAG: hypothetical protein A2516_02345 [Alphaproteobacteria bacterium RIFOXYD12_FULL_60_8]|nr:MAG: hypothetical protein A2516_02345 [Alphaproteobacteria bacterium RIFOXYD12_FULL_60_8]